MSKPVIKIQTKDNIYNIAVAVADDDDERARGLMGQDSLPENEGMLFVYNDDMEVRFWMKNMKISIDIVFIDFDGRILDIKHNVPPCPLNEECILYDPGKPIRYVLELASGFCKKNQVEPGDYVILDTINHY